MLQQISKRAVDYFTKIPLKTPPPPPVVEIEVAKISAATAKEIATLKTLETVTVAAIKGGTFLYGVKWLSEDKDTRDMEKIIDNVNKIQNNVESSLDRYNPEGSQEVSNIPVASPVKNDPLATSLFDSSNNILMLDQLQLNYMYLYHFSLIVLSVFIVYLFKRYVNFFNNLGWFDFIWLSGIIFCGLGILMIKIGVYGEFIDWLVDVEEIP